jgi:hypothetical protein
MERPLTDRQERFVREYLIDHNARQAAIRAGYSPGGQGGAATELMKDPRIKARIRAGLDDLFARLDVTAERVLREYVRMAFFSAGQLIDGEGRPIPLQELDQETLAALNLSYGVGARGPVIRVRSPNKNPALSALQKLLTLRAKLAEEAFAGEDVAEEAPEPWPEVVEAARAAETAVRAPNERGEEAPEAGRWLRNLTLSGTPIPGYPPTVEKLTAPFARPVEHLEPPRPAGVTSSVLAAARRVQRALSHA